MTELDDAVVAYDTGRRPGPRREHVMAPPVRYRVISVDDHVMEPPHIFDGRMPSQLADAAPRVVTRPDGTHAWQFDDEIVPIPTGDAMQSWEPSNWCVSAVSFDEVRPGTWNITDRLRDMDLAGVDVSLSFPSIVFGFAGQRLLRMRDALVALECVRAYNRWVAEEWSAVDPARIIPCQVAWLGDPVVAAAEIRANAGRGFKAVAFTENPERLGLPSLYSGAWDPFFAACEDTETVVNLHVGSSSQTPVPSTQSPLEVMGALFAVNALETCIDWIYAGIPLRFPELRIALSEGGIGWVPMLLDKLRDHSRVYHPDGLGKASGIGAAGVEEIVRRNFWFATLCDHMTLSLRHEIGIDRIMLEVDYPHADSTWPHTQDVIADLVDGMPQDEVDKLTFATAAALYRHPLPDSGVRAKRTVKVDGVA